MINLGQISKDLNFEMGEIHTPILYLDRRSIDDIIIDKSKHQNINKLKQKYPHFLITPKIGNYLIYIEDVVKRVNEETDTWDYTPYGKEALIALNSFFSGEEEIKPAKFVKGILSSISGEKGTGKSRFALSLAFAIAFNQKVLYFTTETEEKTLGAWGIVKTLRELYPECTKNIYIDSSSEVKKQLNLIEREKPDFVVIDSINMIPEIKPTSCKEEILSYRNVADTTNCHIMFISQKNSDGSTKGGSTIPHLVDQVFNLEMYDKKSFNNDIIKLSCSKNRMGAIRNNLIFESSDSFVYRGSEYQYKRSMEVEEDRYYEGEDIYEGEGDIMVNDNENNIIHNTKKTKWQIIKEELFLT